jgi:hypothetical protein
MATISSNTSNVVAPSTALVSQNISSSTDKTTGASTATKTTQGTKVANASDVSKNLTASVQEHVASQPVQSSGLFGSNNNSGDIKQRTTNAQGQADTIAGKIKESGLSNSDALKVEKKFDTELKTAAGQPLTTGQMLDLEIMIDDAATASQTATTTTTPTTQASTASTNFSPIKVAIAGTSSNTGLVFEIDFSSLFSGNKDSVATEESAVDEVDSSANVIQSPSTTIATNKNSGTVTGNSLTQSVDTYTTKLEKKITDQVASRLAQDTPA